MQIKFEIDGVVNMSRNLRNFAAELESLSEFWDNAAGRIIERSKKIFQSEGSDLEKYPSWQPLKASTLKDKARKGFGSEPILVRTGKLRDTFSTEKTKDSVIISKPVPYAIFHQRGGGKLPQRAIMELDNATIQTLIHDLQASVYEKKKTANL